MLTHLTNTPAYDMFDWLHNGWQSHPNIIMSLNGYKCLKLIRIKQEIINWRKIKSIAQLYNFISKIVVTHYFNNIKQWKVTLFNIFYGITWRKTCSIFCTCPLLLQGHFYMFRKKEKRIIFIHTEDLCLRLQGKSEIK